MERGGLKVYTTINPHMQELARKAIAEVLNLPEDPAAAIVTINPANGYIEAMAQSESYEQSQYNLAADGHRQPGSTFKAIVLADALSKGVDPYTTYYLSHTLSPGWLPAEPNYEVQHLRGHLAQQAAQPRAGHAGLRQHRLRPARRRPRRGIDHRKSPTRWASRRTSSATPPQALGGLDLGVTPLEMADVYATLADGGWRNNTIAITKVVFPDGRVDSSWGTPHRVKVLSNGGHRRGDRHPPPERARRHRRALGDRTARPRPRPAPPANSSTRGSTATRPNTRRSSGWATRTERVDDRRPRRSPAGRRAAGGDLARLHGPPSPRHPCVRFPSPPNRSPTCRSSATTPPPGRRQRHRRRAKRTTPPGARTPTAHTERRPRGRRAKTGRPRHAPARRSRKPRRSARPPNVNRTGGAGRRRATRRDRRRDPRWYV